MRTPLSTLSVLLLLAASGLGAEGDTPSLVVEADYGREDLAKETGVVALSGRIRVERGEFSLHVEDGGVVMWVDSDRYREFRKSRGRKKESRGAPAGGKEEPAGAEVPRPGTEEILGPVIRELYAEGEVTFRRGRETIRARRLYFDFTTHRAVILHAELTGEVLATARHPRIPLVLRAERLVQTAKDRLHARDARITTSPYAEPQYEIRVDEITLTRREMEYSFTSTGNVLRVGDLPVLWFPWLYGATDIGLEPIRAVRLGNSSKYGFFSGLSLGTPIRVGTGEAERTVGRWEVAPVYRARRGPGLGLSILYADGGTRGEVGGFYQRDREDRDRVTDLPVPRRDRGRFWWRHRQVLSRDLYGGRLVGLGEISWISDRGFLPEYFPSVDKEGKAQEDVGYLSWSRGSTALSLTGRWRANEFQTQTEYRPRLAFDLVDFPLAERLGGLPVAASLSAEAAAAQVLRVFDHREGERGVLTDRYLARGRLSFPFSAGPVRLVPEFGAGLTSYRARQDADRLDLFAGVRAAVDFWRVFPEVSSDALLLDGLRHVVDVSAGWANRFAVRGAGDLFVQDPEDDLSEVQAVDLRVRNRLQTRRGGAVVDWIDLEIRGLFFPEARRARPAPFHFREEWGLGISSLLLPEEEKFRAIDRKGFGPLLADLRAELRPDLFLVGNAWYDLETDRFETYSEGLRYEAGPDLSLYLGHRAIEGDSSLVTASADFALTRTYSARVFQQVNLMRSDTLTTGLVFRRAFHDFVLEFQFRHNAKERDTSFMVGITPRLLFDWKRRRRSERALDFAGMRWYR